MLNLWDTLQYDRNKEHELRGPNLLYTWGEKKRVSYRMLFGKPERKWLLRTHTRVDTRVTNTAINLKDTGCDDVNRVRPMDQWRHLVNAATNCLWPSSTVWSSETKTNFRICSGLRRVPLETACPSHMPSSRKFGIFMNTGRRTRFRMFPLTVA
jgi:hypothetical protein